MTGRIIIALIGLLAATAMVQAEDTDDGILFHHSDELFDTWREVSRLRDTETSNADTAVSMITNAKGKKRSKVDMVKNVEELKAFCNTVYEKADSYKDNMTAGTVSSLVPFILAYGKKSDHPFISYAKTMAKFRAKWTKGIGKYMIASIHTAVTKGHGAVQREKPKGYVSLKHGAIGTRDRPLVLRKLIVPMTAFQTNLKKIRRGAMKGADAKAAAAWLKQGAKGKFLTFQKRVEGFYKGKIEACFKRTVRAGVRAEDRAYRRAHRARVGLFGQIRVQVPAGIRSTHATLRACGVHVPSPRQLRAIAKAKAREWLRHKKFSMSNANSLVKAYMKDRAPFFIRLKTGTRKNSGSNSKPRFILKGKNRVKKGKLKHAGKQGKEETQLVMAENLGDFKSLTLKAGNRDGWYIRRVSVKQGRHGKWIDLCAQSNGGNPFAAACGAKWLDMKPFDKASSYGVGKVTVDNVGDSWTFVRAPK